MGKKEFFRTRTSDEIGELDDLVRFYEMGDEELDNNPTEILDLEFRNNRDVELYDFENLVERGNFLQIRGHDVKRELGEKMSGKDDLILGYDVHRQPTLGQDKSMRVLFSNLFKAQRVYTYSERLKDTRSSGKTKVGNALDKKIGDGEGTVSYAVNISREETGKGRKRIEVKNVPVKRENAGNNIGELRFENDVLKEYGRYDDCLKSDMFVPSQFAIAGYYQIMKKYYQAYDNSVPFDVNPFPLLSEDIVSFYQDLENTVVVRDELEKRLNGSDTARRRKLNEVEESILAGWQISQVGPDAFAGDTQSTPIQEYEWKKHNI